MKLVYGYGVNDADYKVSAVVDGKQKLYHFYKTWKNMIKRCYHLPEKNRLPTYINCEVDSKWKYFSNFKAWMETQDWEGKFLDKDILKFRNKVYSEENCCFVDRKTNQFVVESDASRGEFLIGCYFEKYTGKFKAQSKDIEGRQINLGRYVSEKEAHLAWLSFKNDQAKILAGMQSDKRVADALLSRYTSNYF